LRDQCPLYKKIAYAVKMQFATCLLKNFSSNLKIHYCPSMPH
jgi:hypothetical protein